jgi:uncharacterized protein (TIGR00251 family)
MKIVETKEGSVLEVYIKPKSKEFKIAVEGDEVVIYSREEPIGGKANKEVIKELSRLFNTNVIIASGFASKTKRLLITNVKKDRVEEILLQNAV